MCFDRILEASLLCTASVSFRSLVLKPFRHSPTTRSCCLLRPPPSYCAHRGNASLLRWRYNGSDDAPCGKAGGMTGGEDATDPTPQVLSQVRVTFGDRFVAG